MPDYAYLLGLYLGDGCMYRYPGKPTHRFQISLDTAYPASSRNAWRR